MENKIKYVLSLFCPTLNLVLESFGYGIKWEYYQKDIKFEKSKNDVRIIKLLCRKNAYTGNCYYRTMRPMSQGYDGNEWVKFDGKDIELNYPGRTQIIRHNNG